MSILIPRYYVFHFKDNIDYSCLGGMQDFLKSGEDLQALIKECQDIIDKAVEEEVAKYAGRTDNYAKGVSINTMCHYTAYEIWDMLNNVSAWKNSGTHSARS